MTQQELSMEFVKYVFWGKLDESSEDAEKIKHASQKAYRDLCRTIKFNDDFKGSGKAKENKRVEIRNKVDEYLSTQMIALVKQQKFTEYTEKHSEICSKIIELFSKATVEFSYGQAQKWVNMTVKYMYILHILMDACLDVCHVPLDNYILDALKVNDIENASTYCKTWSQLCKTDYVNIQGCIKTYLSSIKERPLDWEHKIWLKTAQNKD